MASGALSGGTVEEVAATLNRRYGRESRWMSLAGAASFTASTYTSAANAFALLDPGVKIKACVGLSAGGKTAREREKERQPPLSTGPAQSRTLESDSLSHKDCHMASRACAACCYGC